MRLSTTQKASLAPQWVERRKNRGIKEAIRGTFCVMYSAHGFSGMRR